MRKFPGKKYWQMAKLKVECMGYSIYGQICPECQKSVTSYKFFERHWNEMRDEMQSVALAAKVKGDLQ